MHALRILLAAGVVLAPLAASAQAGAPSDAQIAGIVVAANPVDINEVTHHLTMKATLVVK